MKWQQSYKSIIKRYKRRAKTSPNANWVKDIIHPLSELINNKLKDRVTEILGPFGIGAKVGVYFITKETADKPITQQQYISLTFEPINLSEGKLSLVDYTHNTQRYKPGTTGEMNGFNFETIIIPPNAGPDWFIEYMCNQNEKIS